MREFKRNCLAILFMAALAVPLAWVFGFTLDGAGYGHWPHIDDHPTNWFDTTAQPDTGR